MPEDEHVSFLRNPFLNFTLKANGRRGPNKNASSRTTGTLFKISSDTWYMLCWHVDAVLAVLPPTPPPSYCCAGYVRDINVTMLCCSAVETNVSSLKENFNRSCCGDSEPFTLLTNRRVCIGCDMCCIREVNLLAPELFF